MTKVNASEMRSVTGGAHYATCPVCGYRKKLKWTLHVLFVGWNRTVAETEESMNWSHWVLGRSCH